MLNIKSLEEESGGFWGVAALGALDVATVHVAEIEVWKLSLGGSPHLVVEGITCDWFTSEEPQEALEGTT